MPSQSAADDRDGSKLAGCERPLGDWGAHPAPIDDAMSVGTMVISEGLQSRKKFSGSVRLTAR